MRNGLINNNLTYQMIEILFISIGIRKVQISQNIAKIICINKEQAAAF